MKIKSLKMKEMIALRVSCHSNRAFEIQFLLEYSIQMNLARMEFFMIANKKELKITITPIPFFAFNQT